MGVTLLISRDKLSQRYTRKSNTPFEIGITTDSEVSTNFHASGNQELRCSVCRTPAHLNDNIL